MYPDDNDLKGSSTFFIALLQKCLEKDLVAICRFTPRASSPPRNVALLPHNGSESTPHGFYIIYLPYSDDIRDVETPRHQTQATESQVAAAEAMIRKLRFKYDPDNFDNPAIQTHYKNLEAMALGKAQPDPVIDHTIPDFERIEKKAGALIENFKELVFPPDYDPNKQPTKHKADSTTRESKRSKTEGTEVNIKEAVENRTLGKFTVLQLKEICKELGVKSSGKKADIITSIMDYYG
uniref:SAP domain-containing protein n=1 Tax=Ciona savignyi TaxID=51511 RepID=H2Y8Q5_CIOSA